MPWQAGTYSKGNNSTGGWTGDASLGIGIEAGRHDTQDNDFATGINQCLNKDGSNSCTGDLNLGGFKPVNLAAGTAAAPAICAGGDVNTGIFSPAADEIGIATNGVERIKVNANGNIERSNVGNSVFRARGFYNSGGSNETSMQLSQNWNYDTNTADSTLNGTAAIMIEGGASNYAAIKFLTNSNNTAPAERMRVTNDGRVGVGVTAPTKKFEIAQTAYNDGLAINGTVTNAGAFLHFLDNGTQRNAIWWDVGGFATGSVNSLAAISGTTGGVYLAVGGTSWIAISDEREKKNVETLNYGLAEVLQLNAVRFDYKNDETNTSERLGFIAQQVKPIIPEIVEGSEELKLGLSQTELIPVLVKAIQELNAKVEALEARVAELEAA